MKRKFSLAKFGRMLLLGLAGGMIVAASVAGSASALTYDWEQNGTHVFYDDGYVGIGTGSPAQDLHVQINAASGDRTIALFENTASGSSATGNIKVQTGDSGISMGAFHPDYSVVPNHKNKGVVTSSSNNGLVLDAYGASSIMTFETGSHTERMRIDQNGNVGIGTTNPVADLHVSGGTGSVELLIEADTDNSNEADQPVLTLSQDGGLVKGQLGYFDNSNSLKLINNYGDASILLRDNGNIGIGTAAPSSKLTVGGDISLDDNFLYNVRALQLKDWDDNTGGTDDKYRLLARDGAWQFYNGGVVVGSYGNGTWSDLADGRLIVEDRIGIGTTNPGVALDVGGAADATGSPNTGLLEVGGGLRLDGNEIITNSGTTLHLQNDNNGDLRVDGGTLFVDASANRVGVGTTSPSEKITVKDTGSGNTMGLSSVSGAYTHINFKDGNNKKWELGKRADNSFYIYDESTTSAKFTIQQGGEVCIGKCD